MRAYHVTPVKAKLRAVELPEPAPPCPNGVVVEMRAASLNYRDLAMSESETPFVPLSDGAGIVRAVGADVASVAPGDRVVIGFMPGWVDGAITSEKQASALGAPGHDGVLRESATVPAGGVVKLPSEMTFEEAATLPCAAVTAWAALFERRPLLPGEWVLLLGTGGVSIFALQFAKQAGARVVITSSSDAKLARARELGADATVNYRTASNWGAAVIEATGGAGADLAVDVGGPATLGTTLEAVRMDGRISLMGVLTGTRGELSTVTILRKRITLQGIYVGPASMLRDVVRAAPKPVIDGTFGFDDAEEAFATLAAADHFGKLVVRFPSNGIGAG